MDFEYLESIGLNFPMPLPNMEESLREIDGVRYMIRARGGIAQFWFETTKGAHVNVWLDLYCDKFGVALGNNRWTYGPLTEAGRVVNKELRWGTEDEDLPITPPTELLDAARRGFEAVRPVYEDWSDEEKRRLDCVRREAQRVAEERRSRRKGFLQDELARL